MKNTLAVLIGITLLFSTQIMSQSCVRAAEEQLQSSAAAESGEIVKRRSMRLRAIRLRAIRRRRTVKHLRRIRLNPRTLCHVSPRVDMGEAPFQPC